MLNVGVLDRHCVEVEDEVTEVDGEAELHLVRVGEVLGEEVKVPEVDEKGLELLVLGNEVATGVSVGEVEVDTVNENVGELETHAEVLAQTVGVEDRHSVLLDERVREGEPEIERESLTEGEVLGEEVYVPEVDEQGLELLVLGNEVAT